MGRFTLDELESDEIHAALVERRADLTKRVTKLVEDSLPEAADGVRTRLRLYDGHEGPDGKARPGLVRMFAPQRDIETDADQQRREQKRDDGGQQDAFGGGAETGGRPRDPKPAASVPADSAGAEVIDVDYEIIPEGRRISSKSTITIESALAILAQIARVLRGGPEFLPDPEYDKVGSIVVAVFPALKPDIDRDHVEAHVMEELRDAQDNAHGLASYIERNVALIRDKIDNPITKKPAEPAGEGSETGDEIAEVVDDTIKGTDPIDDASAEALRGMVFPGAPAEGRNADGGLSFETPPGTGGTEPPKGETKSADPETKAPPAETKKAAGGTTKPKGSGGRKKKGNK